MPSRSVVRPQAGTAWRVAAVMVGAVLLVVASVAGVNAWSAGIGLNVRFAIIPNALPAGDTEGSGAPAAPPVPGPGAGAKVTPQNILVLGVDSSGLARDDASALSVPPRSPDAATLSSVLLVNIPATRTSVSVLSLLPDMTVPVSQREPVTLRQALSSGGVASVVGGVQDLVGTRIQHVAAIEVAALGVMTDAVGGVDLVASSESPLGSAGERMPGGRLSGSGVRDLLQGPSPADATQSDALTPDLIADGVVRAETEQAVVRASLASAERKGTFRSLRDTGALADDLARFIAVDDGLTVGYLSSLQLKLGDVDSDVRFGTLQAAGIPGSAAAVPDATALAAVQQALDSDSLADYLARVTPTD
jgi:LytR_cpsA_psr family